MNLRDRVSAINTQVMLAIAVLLIGGVFSILSPVFLCPRNFMNIGISSSILGIMATGATVMLLVGGLDISQCAVGAITGLFAALILKMGAPFGVILMAVAGCGAACGSINAFVITRMRINPIIATLGTMLVFRAAAFIMTGGKYLAIDDVSLNFIGRGRFLGVPAMIWTMLLSYLVFYLMLRHTRFGRNIFAVGSNPTASFLSGININRVRFGAYVISGLMGGVGGFLMASQIGAGMPTAGQGGEMDVIVAVVLGGISLSGGKGNILGTLLGVLFLGILSNGLTLLNVQAYYQMLIRGVFLILAVFLDSLRGGGYR